MRATGPGLVQRGLRGGLGPARLLIALQTPFRFEQRGLPAREMDPGGSDSGGAAGLPQKEEILILGDEPPSVEEPGLDEAVNPRANVGDVLGLDAHRRDEDG